MSKTTDAQIQATNNPHDRDPFHLKSKATLASSAARSHSLRATVPEGIVAFLDLKAGEHLAWKMDITSDGQRFAVVKKVKTP